MAKLIKIHVLRLCGLGLSRSAAAIAAPARTSGNPHVPHPACHSEREDKRAGACTQNARDHHGGNQFGESKERVRRAHSDPIRKPMTISNDEAKILEVPERAQQAYINEYSIKNMLKPDPANGDSREANFVGLDAYKAAGGNVTNNLFEDEVLLDNPDILDRVFAEDLEIMGPAFEQEGNPIFFVANIARK